jgi:hypothetical protein
VRRETDGTAAEKAEGVERDEESRVRVRGVAIVALRRRSGARDEIRELAGGRKSYLISRHSGDKMSERL